MKKGRVAFLQPQECIPDNSTIPPLGVLYLLAISEKMGLEGRFFDQRLNKNAIDQLIPFQPDLVGITATTSAFNQGLKAINVLKKSLPHAIIAIGGPHASVLPQEAIEAGADIAIVGEGELAWQLICEAVFNRGERPKGWLLGARADETHSDKANMRLLTSEELNELPFPAFHLMDLEKYFSSSQRHGLYQRGKRILPIITSRGCSFHCTFCTHMMGHRVRARSSKSVLTEIEFLCRNYGVDEIFFEDDFFFFDRERALDILDRLSRITPQLHIKFANGVRADSIDQELLKTAKRAGAYSITFGIESGCEKTLKKMKKHLDLGKVQDLVKLAREEGFLVGGNCILGYPEETEADTIESIKFFYSLHLDSCAIVNLIPFPGTEVYQECKRKGYLNAKAKDWDNYSFNLTRPIILCETPEMTSEKITKIIHNSYRKLYLRPYMLKNLISQLTMKQLLYIIKYGVY
jgi:radical SAM superfamily enzyme YgiQ (UPF0313 family)